MRVRPAEPGDVPQIAALEAAAFTCPWTAETLRTDLTQNKLARYFCLEAEGQVRGYIALWLILDEAHIINFAIRPDYRRRGWGELLFRAAAAELIGAGIRRLTLEVRSSNAAALALYRKLGFRAEGVRPHYYDDNREDAVVMWADLPDPADLAVMGEEERREDK
jgi:ribosomal-protein-alanine N-acetyltransferase